MRIIVRAIVAILSAALLDCWMDRADGYLIKVKLKNWSLF